MFLLIERASSNKKKKKNLKTVEMQHVNTQISPELAYGKKKKVRRRRGDQKVRKQISREVKPINIKKKKKNVTKREKEKEKKTQIILNCKVQV